MKIDLNKVKTLKEFRELIGDPNELWKIRDEWNVKRLKIGEWYRYDTSEFFESYRLKNKHLKKCKLVEISCLKNLGTVIFEDGTKTHILLEYLIPLNAVTVEELKKAKGKKFSLLDFIDLEAVNESQEA